MDKDKDRKPGDNLEEMGAILRDMFQKVLLDGYKPTDTEVLGLLAMALHFETMFSLSTGAISHALEGHGGLLKRGVCPAIDGKMKVIGECMDTDIPLLIIKGEMPKENFEVLADLLKGVMKGEDPEKLISKAIFHSMTRNPGGKVM